MLALFDRIGYWCELRDLVKFIISMFIALVFIVLSAHLHYARRLVAAVSIRARVVMFLEWLFQHMFLEL